jgi:hypothetical protein
MDARIPAKTLPADHSVRVPHLGASRPLALDVHIRMAGNEVYERQNDHRGTSHEKGVGPAEERDHDATEVPTTPDG